MVNCFRIAYHASIELSIDGARAAAHTGMRLVHSASLAATERLLLLFGTARASHKRVVLR